MYIHHHIAQNNDSLETVRCLLHGEPEKRAKRLFSGILCTGLKEGSDFLLHFQRGNKILVICNEGAEGVEAEKNEYNKKQFL